MNLLYMYMHSIIRFSLASLLLLTLGSGCASVPQKTETAQTSSTQSEVLAAFNACDIVTQEMATDALGIPVGKGTNFSGDYNNGVSGSSTCDYQDTSGGTTLTLRVFRSRVLHVTTDLWDQSIEWVQPPHKEIIPDLGDKAVFINPTKYDPTVALKVMKDSTLYWIILVGKDDARSIEQSIATKILSEQK